MGCIRSGLGVKMEDHARCGIGVADEQVAGHHFNRLGRVPPTPARAPHAEEGWGGGTG